MKYFLTTLFLSTTAISPAFATDYTFPSNMSAVTVYPRGAQVLRVALGDVEQGEHVIIVDDLPGEVVANSVRVEGKSGVAIEIGSVDVRQVYVSSEDKSGERQSIERQIEGLNDEISRLNQDVENSNIQRELLKRLATQTIAPRGKDNTSALISAAELNDLLNLTGSRFDAISKVTAKARISQRELSREIDELRKKINELAPKQELRTVVAINLASTGAGETEFFIRYNVDNAGWAPVYDAKLALGDNGKNSTMKLVRRASVTQATTETWENVQLTLSTARPRGNTQAPKLSPYLLRERRDLFEKRKRDRLGGVVAMSEAPAPAPLADEVAEADIRSRAMKPVAMRQAQVAFAGFLAEYKISGNVSVVNTGAEKNVTIGSEELDADISVHSVPKIDPTAYLTAEFSIEGKALLLPGIVMLSRDGVFLGKGRLPLLNPGEEHSLGFGRDDLIKIKRVQVSDKKGESGFISSVNVAERRYVTTVENLHDFAMNVSIEDQIPYGTHEDIVVELLANSTKPSVVDVKKKRGVLAWENNITAGEKTTIDFGYKVSWPKDMKITPIR